MKTFLLVTVLIFSLSHSLSAQTFKNPDPALVEKAMNILDENLFARLEAGNANELAEWVTDQTHSEASGTTRMQSLNQFQSQFGIILQSGPDSPFGNIEGYDLIQQSALPGTDRYFRLLYMSYHRKAPLLWEVHFYVQHDGELSVTYFQFDGQNPFAYLTTPDMLIDQYYNRY